MWEAHPPEPNKGKPTWRLRRSGCGGGRTPKAPRRRWRPGGSTGEAREETRKSSSSRCSGTTGGDAGGVLVGGTSGEWGYRGGISPGPRLALWFHRVQHRWWWVWKMGTLCLSFSQEIQNQIPEERKRDGKITENEKKKKKQKK
ncbi:unnamed protein product, partial [Vitis vinifera]